MRDPHLTPPLRRQYLEIKRRYPDMLVLFQVGDFFEAFDEDAVTLARELGLVLTTKYMGKTLRVPLAGIPVTSLTHHLGKLIQKGYKVAICEQLTPPGRRLIHRDVTRVVTPGTLTEPALLEERASNYLASFCAEGERAGLAIVEVTTGEFMATEAAREQIWEELTRLGPTEVLVPQSVAQTEGAKIPAFTLGRAATVTPLEDEAFAADASRHALSEQLGAIPPGMPPLALRAAGAIVHYLRRTQPRLVEQLDRVSTYALDAFMVMDPHTIAHLEIFHSRAGTTEGSLLGVLDRTLTPMGSRRLKQWLRYPLVDLAALHARQEAVHWFLEHATIRREFRAQLGQLTDVERVIGRIASGSATPREVIALGRSARTISALRALFADSPSPLRPWLADVLPLDEIAQLIAEALVEDPPPSIEQGGVIRAGFSEELDQLRALLKNGKAYLADLEARERARTGIRSLKVGYNKVFGYYIEVTKPNLHLVPPEYIRKQTLTGAERFFTLELKEHETVVAHAEERIRELETSLFRQLCARVAERRADILRTARALGELDVLATLAEAAAAYGYVRPQLVLEPRIVIRGGRHPVVERTLPAGQFVPNDTTLSAEDAQILILTGPNLSGKSTYLRQVALIVLLAQIGSFVPADDAIIGVTDRLFYRFGSEDYISQGRSSFFVEMMETAAILHHATPRSLILFDEIGRGTSTYDGMALARAVIEYLHNHPRVRARTLFATHFHELTELEEILPRVKNVHILVVEENGQLRFLHRVVPGRATRSYGVQVARLAGLPRPVVHRAEELLAEYEASNPRRVAEMSADYHASALREIAERLKHLDPNALTPIEALTMLYELKRALEARSPA
ncbi:MAG: DNA mismatch repair protein MutS [Blastocatellia bacterium]|nr:DNA mismatch repair protein MutS [Blastocatellia bacterium]MCS7156157.1 DNA mismatch repair protein MutS [Blastocatellia bacterium]MCX7751492.1 DNA mismatch repair protein MutS [Blastocatellia bacterium]MDW8169205.1 DNA mismatch repair protein MutS [Acidobacteriota bacterium]MDW8256066.1 DNA mismatch repair protein MutS [Acidobacteriota bacterium]